MIPIHQTRSGAKGNCFEACLASIMERTIAEIPDFFSAWSDIRRFVEHAGYELQFRIVAEEYPLAGYPQPPQGHAIAALRLPNGAIHSVVCENGRLAHDPSPRAFCRRERCHVLLWTIIRRKH